MSDPKFIADLSTSLDTLEPEDQVREVMERKGLESPEKFLDSVGDLDTAITWCILVLLVAGRRVGN